MPGYLVKVSWGKKKKSKDIALEKKKLKKNIHFHPDINQFVDFHPVMY